MYVLNITSTERCNCNCKYCFEQYYDKHDFSIEEQELQSKLIVDVCRCINERHDKILLCFWGGEPFMNIQFVTDIMERTMEFDGVSYMFYTNGILFDTIKKFINSLNADKIHDRLSFRISYDGKIPQLINRCNPDIVIQSWKLLNSYNIKSYLWPTITASCFKYMPQVWDEFKGFRSEYDFITYSPIIDTTQMSLSEFRQFKQSLSELISREYDYIKLNNRSLCEWFSQRPVKEDCRIDNVLTLTTDGRVLNCHGAPYSPFRDSITIAKTIDVENLIDAFKVYELGKANQQCDKCIATQCFMCRVIQVQDVKCHQDMIDQWESCRTNNPDRCEYYKEIGIADRHLKNALVFNDRSILEDYKIRIQ